MHRNETLTRQALPPKDASRRRAAIMAAHPPPHEGRIASDSFDSHDGGGVAAMPAQTESVVSLCSRVEILDLRTQERQEYTLVSPCNADFWLNRISTLTPLGR